MRNAETVLSIIRERGKQGLLLEDVYRQLYNPSLYLMAYAKIYRNGGAMTPGITPETVDGMSLSKIEAMIALLREEKYRFSPVRRVYIEKKNSAKKRPLGIPTWSDKLLQEVIRLLLEAYYDPQMSPASHGFRPQRGCHTALTEIERQWRGTVWFIEGDIKGCFDSIDHTVLLSILREKIRDNRFLHLIESLLRAGYLEEWKYGATLSGTPQGGIVSPILANLYLDRLDQFVAQTLVLAYNRGESRGRNPHYEALTSQWHYRQRMGRTEEAKRLHRQARTIPSRLTDDPNYRRLRYVRYADDFLLGFAGPRVEAEAIKAQLQEFLCDSLKLELSPEKTLVTHGRTQAARFLGYDIRVLHNDSYRTKDDTRKINGNIGLFVPAEVVKARCRRYMKSGKPSNRPYLLRDSEYTILRQYQAEYRGFANYYQLAVDRSVKLRRLKWVMEVSLTQTLANKLRCKVGQVYDRYATTLQTEQGNYKVLQVKVARVGKPPLVATWGGISLARVRNLHQVVLLDSEKPSHPYSTELLTRLLQGHCELCGSQERLEVHHVRHLKDLGKAGRNPRPTWVVRMAQRQRKTLVVCHECHRLIHNGSWDGTKRDGAPSK